MVSKCICPFINCVFHTVSMNKVVLNLPYRQSYFINVSNEIKYNRTLLWSNAVTLFVIFLWRAVHFFHFIYFILKIIAELVRWWAINISLSHFSSPQEFTSGCRVLLGLLFGAKAAIYANYIRRDDWRRWSNYTKYSVSLQHTINLPLLCGKHIDSIFC